MKNIILLFILIGSLSYGQNETYNKLAIISSPGAYNDGVNLGVQFERQNKTIHYGLEVFVFPDLNSYDYYHSIFRIGLHQSWNWFRLHAGPRAGFLLRKDDQFRLYQILGLESGFDIILNNIFFGAAITSDMKNDSKMWSNEDYHTVNSVIVRIGYKF